MSPTPPAKDRADSDPKTPPANNLWRVLGTFFSWAMGLSVAAGLTVLLLVGVALVMAYPQLPDISDLADYRPKLSMRVFSVEGKVIGEFGEERRKLIPFKEIPDVVKQAVLSIEDARFYQHGGVDYIGLARASLANVGRAKSQGASTITCKSRAMCICLLRKLSHAKFTSCC
jgi:penicillin-binding protein 1A